MKIIVPIKLVPDLVEELVVNDDGTGLDPDEIETKLNEFDDHAIEEALLLREASGGEITVMALDAEGVDKILYTALAKGADKAVKLTGPDAEDVQGNVALARLFAEALGEMSYDLVLTGVQACDDRDGQFGPILASLLGVPSVSVVTGVSAKSPSCVGLVKEYSGGLTARFELDLPAVLGVQAAGQMPRYAPVSKVRQIQQSVKLGTVEVGDPEAPRAKVVAMTPPQRGAGARMLPDVAALIAVLKEKGALA